MVAEEASRREVEEALRREAEDLEAAIKEEPEDRDL